MRRVLRGVSIGAQRIRHLGTIEALSCTPPISAPFNLSYYLKPIRVLNQVMCACTRNTTLGNDVTHACKDVFLFSVTTVLPPGASARDLLGFEREWHDM